MIERALVVGSNSFSGSHMVARLLAGGSRVVGVSRSEEPDLPFRPYATAALEEPGRFRFVRCDLNGDLAPIVASLADLRPTHVFNFAAQSMVAESWRYPTDWYRTNVVGLARLAEILADAPGLERLVHVTTPEVYGSSDDWIEENWSFAPSTPYAASRAAGDWHLRLLVASGRLPVVFTRAANVYGPGQQLYRIIPRSLLAARNGGRLPLHGGGVSRRSFIHIADVVEGTLRAATDGVPGQCYHLSTTQVTSIRDLVALIARMTDLELEQLADIAPERPGKDAAYLLDSTRVRSDLGWRDLISLEDGIRETLGWVDENLQTLRCLPLEYEHRP